jgi:FkbM family methyltransferase
LQERLTSLEASMETRFDGIEVAVTALRERVVPRSDTTADAGNGHSDATVQAGNGHSAGSDEPELALVAHLAHLLPNRVAFDVGANLGRYSDALLDAGFAVHAFEPNPAVLDKLRARLQERAGFSAHGFALGSADGRLPLHLVRDVTVGHEFADASIFSTLGDHPLPEGLEKAEDVEVPVRTLDSLHAHGLLPSECSYLKVDTEGFDLEVVRGMGTHRYPMVSLEFWDKNLPFGRGVAQNGLPDLVAEMQQRGYGSWIVLYRVWGDNQTVRFYSNSTKTFDRSWGNAFFFQDATLFEVADRWCSASLERARIEVPKKRGNGEALLAP